MSIELRASGLKSDKIKLAIALLMVVSALVAFYLYAEQSLLYRVLGLLLTAGVAIAIAIQTEQGRRIKGYLVDAQVEVRKVVWPTRKETVHTTLLVIGMVILVAIILWALDAFLGWAISSLMGQR